MLVRVRVAERKLVGGERVHVSSSIISTVAAEVGGLAPTAVPVMVMLKLSVAVRAGAALSETL